MQRFYLMRMEALAGPNPNRLAKRDLPRLPHPPQFSPLILTGCFLEDSLDSEQCLTALNPAA